jgi:signal transduction histidine kinase
MSSAGAEAADPGGRGYERLALDGPNDELRELGDTFDEMLGDLEASFDGHGLGLSIVNAIATAHRATLTVHSRPEGGLRVEVRFRDRDAYHMGLAFCVSS